ncbi:MAG: META domain-containing protein [Leptolyngbyaceae cyanobacterium]
MIKVESISWAIASAVTLIGTVDLGTAAAQDPMLVGTVWQLEEIIYNNDTMATPESPEDYTIQFFEDNTLGIKADCNVGGGEYNLDGNDFITLGPFTLAFCGPDSIDDEFRQGLEDAVNYFFRDGDLYMDMFADAGTMKFIAAEPTADMEAETEVTEDDVETEPAETTAPDTTSEPVRGLW